MRHALNARHLVVEVSARLGLDAALIEEIFSQTPLDFTVVISPRLPLLAHRFGMIGITIGARVWLLDAVRALPLERLIAIVRHEAEHVRQQRAHRFSFFPRYGLEYLRGLIVPADDIRVTQRARTWTRSYLAYRAIGYEREAYSAEALALATLARARNARPPGE